jgi:hypothetical protein
MDYMEILKTIQPLLVLVLTYLVSYLVKKIELTRRISTVIGEAEVKYQEAQKAGKQKMGFAVDFLYKYVPVYLKPFITKELIAKMVQETFDETKRYVDSQLDKTADKINHKLDEGVGK